MRSPAKRGALGAVRHKTQWRIPLPANVDLWEVQTREHLTKAGIKLKPAWARDLERLGQEYDRCMLQVSRLWLAAYRQLLRQGLTVTQEAKDSIILLSQIATELLKPLSRYKMDVEQLKSDFPTRLRLRGLSSEEVHVVMRYWPGREHFRLVANLRTRADVETVRRQIDYALAAQKLEREGWKPTADNLKPLLHHNMTSQINDSPEQLPGVIVKPQNHEQLRRLVNAAVCDNFANRKSPDVTLDFRKPQAGLSLRTFRDRFPKKQKQNIIGTVYRAETTVPGDEANGQGKRSSKL